MRTLGSALLLCVVAAPAWSEEIVHDFRGGKFDDQLFRYDGPNAEQFIKLEEQGLRITIPAGKAPKAAVGIYIRGPVRGDFTATTRYEIIQVDQPLSGWGVGVEMYLMCDNAVRDGISSIPK